MNKLLIFSFIVALAPVSFGQTARNVSNPSAMIAPTDAEIAAIVDTANRGEIELSQLAQKKSNNSAVKDFSQQMIEVHKKNNDEAKQLTKKLNITPAQNTESRNLQSMAKSSLEQLRNLKGDAFDRAYAEKAVSMHQAVLDSLDKSMIPNAKNPELKAMLEKTRPVVSAHLEHAKDLQKKIDQKTSM